MPHCREALQHGRVSLCRAAGGQLRGGMGVPEGLCCSLGLWGRILYSSVLACCEMGSGNARLVLLRKGKSGRRAGKTLQCQVLLFLQCYIAPLEPGAGQAELSPMPWVQCSSNTYHSYSKSPAQSLLFISCNTAACRSINHQHEVAKHRYRSRASKRQPGR